MTSHGVNGGAPRNEKPVDRDTELPNDLRKNSGEFAGAFFRRPITLGREFTGEFTRDRFDRLVSLEYRGGTEKRGRERDRKGTRGTRETPTRHEGSRLKSQLEIFSHLSCKISSRPEQIGFHIPGRRAIFPKTRKTAKSQNRLRREIRLRFDFA